MRFHRVVDAVVDMAVPVAVVAATVALFAAVVMASMEDAKSWDAFKAEHKCKVVSRISGDAFTTFGVSTSGNPVVGVGSTPDKTGWQCDDGIIYYR